MSRSRVWKACRPWLIPISGLLGPVIAVWAYTPNMTDPARASVDGTGYPGALLLGVIGGVVVGYILRTAGDVTFGTGSFKDHESAL
jgi:hypothetical protein